MRIFKHLLFGGFASLFLLGSAQAQACTFSASFSGPTMVCAGSSVYYVTEQTSGHYYRWAFNGAIVVTGTGTDSITVNWPTPGTGSAELFDSTSTCVSTITKTIQVGLSSVVLTQATYNVEGSASAPSSGRTYTITSNSTDQYGAVWNNYGINLNKNFDFTFTTNQDGTADGMMFVIQNTSNTAAPSSDQGSDLGYYQANSGDMNESVGVEEDIYLSGTGFDDSSASHLNLVQNQSATPIRPQVNISPALGGGSNHTLRVTWDRDINLFVVYFDGTKEFSWPNDLVKNVFGGNPNVWFGFTGATGGSTSTQTITTDTLIYDQAIINATSDTICTGDSMTLTSSFGVSYNWSTGAKTRSINVLKTGTYSVTVTDSFNCVSTASISIPTIVTLPQVSASFTVGNGCIGNNVPIANSTTPTSGVRYIWNFGNGNSATGNPPAYSYLTTGNYTISVIATNGGCTDTASNPITVYNHPGGITLSKSTPFQGQFNTGDIYHSDNACIGDTNTYQFSPPIGYANSDYGSKWVISSKTFTTAGGTVNTDTVFKNPTASKNAYFQFFPDSKFADSVLILTMHIKLIPGNCDTEITRYIQARPNAVSKFVFANACEGFALSFHDTSTISSGDAISNWNWDFGDGAASTLQNPSHPYSKPGTYSVTLSATSNAGCGIPVTQTVTQYPVPVAVFYAAIGCQDVSSVFTDSSTISSGSIISTAWNFGDGTTSALKNPIRVYPKSGPYNVKLVVASALGCKDSLTKPIRVEPTPIASFGYNDACVGTQINFTNASTDSSTGTTYIWNFGDGTAISKSALPSHIYTANGTYDTKLTVTSKYGCADTATLKITPYAETVPNIVYSGACTKNAVAFGDSDKNDVGATYSWNFGDLASYASINDTSFHVYNKAGTFKVSLSIQNAEGCVDTGSRSLTISDYPVASFLAANVCEGKPLTFSNSSTGTGLSYLWDFGDTTSGKSNSSTLQGPTHTYDTVGTYTVTLWATNPGGCTDSISQTANSVAPPVVGPWNYKIHNQTVTFTPRDTTQQTYKWYFGTGDSSSTKSPVYMYPGKGTYGVKLVETNSTGCSGSYSDSITLTGLGLEPVSGPNNNLNIGIYPNPFESKTTISYTLTNNSTVNVSVYDIQGKLVAGLRNGNFSAGKYQDVFDATKCNATDGAYLVKMTVNGEVFTGRIVEMK